MNNDGNVKKIFFSQTLCLGDFTSKNVSHGNPSYAFLPNVCQEIVLKSCNYENMTEEKCSFIFLNRSPQSLRYMCTQGRLKEMDKLIK